MTDDRSLALVEDVIEGIAHGEVAGSIPAFSIRRRDDLVLDVNFGEADSGYAVTISAWGPLTSFSIGEMAAARAAFSLAGFNEALRTLPVASEDERIFVIDPDRLATMGDSRSLEQVLSQLLGRKVIVTEDRGGASVEFH